jgi:outer membrane protein assembly factor BamB
MKNFLHSVFVATIAALLVAGASLRSDAVAQLRPSAYDGQWSVIIYTTRGDCDSKLRYSVRIVDGHVQAGEQSYQAAGRVEPNGYIRVVVAEGGRTASGSGRLTRDTGRGLWRTTTGQCAGQWTAERRG